MVTDAQVRVLRRKRMEGKTQEGAAAAAGMSVRSARTWEHGPLPSQTTGSRSWRTRSDPFATVWETEVLPLLEADEDGGLEATTIFDALRDGHPEQFEPGQLRTLQRRMREWRALHGPAKEVFFEQVHPPGREAQFDFTHGTALGVTIAGEVFAHLFFELVLSYSGWRYVALAFGETFEAMVAGLQDAFWELGGVVAVVRHDNLSAATHELRVTGGRTLTRRFREVLTHYGLESTRIQPGRAHENGIAEQAHDTFKRALDQALRLRGSRDFATVDDYLAVVTTVRRRLNTRVERRFAEERAVLRPLPAARIPAYTTVRATVRRWSTIRVGGRTYSVPARLIGHQVEVRQHPDTVEVYYRGRVAETMPRLRGRHEHRIDYRHVIWSLVRKPGAFARYRFREDLFPSLTFRRAYDALRASRGERADVDYVRVLHLAASTMEADVERALVTLLGAGAPFEYATVRALAAPAAPRVPMLRVPEPDLTVYDALLASGGGR